MEHAVAVALLDRSERGLAGAGGEGQRAINVKTRNRCMTERRKGKSPEDRNRERSASWKGGRLQGEHPWEVCQQVSGQAVCGRSSQVGMRVRGSPNIFAGWSTSVGQSVFRKHLGTASDPHPYLGDDACGGDPSHMLPDFCISHFAFCI